MMRYDEMDETGIQGEVEELLVECIGDDSFLEDENYLDLDLFDEYDLDIYGLVEIVQALNERFELGVTPTQVEQDEINTVSKVVRFVEDYMAEL